MNHEELIKLIETVNQSSLKFFNFETDGTKLILAKEMPNNPIIQQQEIKEPEILESAPVAVKVDEIQVSESVETLVAEEGAEGKIVTSPMVGVVYLQANPDSEPFVNVGDTVNEGDTILIVEAMKLMNEIQSTHSGVITEILVENETVVEFGQPLVRIK